MNLSRTKREAKGARCMQEKRRRQEADRGSEGNGSGGEVDPAAFRRGAPRANHRTRRRCGSSTSTKPSRRPPLPLRCAQERSRLRSSAAKKASREESRLSTAGALEITREILHLGRGHQLPTRDTTHLVTFEHDGLQVCPGSVDCSSVPGRAGTNDHQVLHSLARICNNQQPPRSIAHHASLYLRCLAAHSYSDGSQIKRG